MHMDAAWAATPAECLNYNAWQGMQQLRSMPAAWPAAPTDRLVCVGSSPAPHYKVLPDYGSNLAAEPVARPCSGTVSAAAFGVQNCRQEHLSGFARVRARAGTISAACYEKRRQALAASICTSSRKSMHFV